MEEESDFRKREQDRFKHYLKHFGIPENGLGGVTFTEIPNNENTRKVYGIERIMLGREERKIRIILDVDMDCPVFILRVFPENNLQEEKEVSEVLNPNK